MVYVESGRGIDLSAGWRLHRQARAGQVTYQLFCHDEK
jgi:hypothetical protein